MDDARQRSRGFTLFEVMAAVLILGLMYSLLARAAIDGVRSEGATKRRMEASLLADQQFAEIETAIHTGFPPELGENEFDLDPFTVSVQVLPFDATPYLGEEAEIAEEAKAFFDPSGDAPLRIIDLRVFWLEGDRELEVRRTTFAYDNQLIAGLTGGAPGESDPDPEPESNDDELDVDTMFQMLQSGGGR